MMTLDSDRSPKQSAATTACAVRTRRASPACRTALQSALFLFLDIRNAVKGVGSYASKLNKKLTASITSKIENVSSCCCAACRALNLAPQETAALTTKMGTKLDIIKSKE